MLINTVSIKLQKGLVIKVWKKVNKITLSKHTITQHIEELSYDVSWQQKDRVHTYSFFSLAMDNSPDICDEDQISIFIRGSDGNYNIFEEIIGIESVHGKTRRSDIFEEVK